MAHYDKQIVIRIDKDSYKLLREVAKSQGLNTSTLIRYLIFKELKKWRKENLKSSTEA